MAENTDPAQKTEEPTEKRLNDAREKGDVAHSREVANWFMITAGALALTILLPGAGRRLADHLGGWLHQAHAIPAGGLPAALQATGVATGKALAPTIVLLVLAALAAGLAQNGFLFAPERIKPAINRISPVSGCKRLFSVRALSELAKGLIKLLLVGAVATIVMQPLFGRLGQLPVASPGDGLRLLHDAVVRVALGVAAILAPLAIADIFASRFGHRKKLRMTREETKDELRQSEGDPHIRARLRAIRSERARRRMIQAVPEADVVITNPTHYAVALRYDAATMGAPRLVARGTDRVAARIRDVALAHDVPLVENPPLARALHGSLEIDQEIRPEHYKAVAGVIAFVMRRR